MIQYHEQYDAKGDQQILALQKTLHLSPSFLNRFKIYSALLKACQKSCKYYTTLLLFCQYFYVNNIITVLKNDSPFSTK